MNHPIRLHIDSRSKMYNILLYPVSPSPDSDVVRLFAKSSYKLHAPSAHRLTRTKKTQRVCIRAYSFVCVHTSLLRDGETEYIPYPIYLTLCSGVNVEISDMLSIVHSNRYSTLIAWINRQRQMGHMCD